LPVAPVLAPAPEPAPSPEPAAQPAAEEPEHKTHHGHEASDAPAAGTEKHADGAEKSKGESLYDLAKEGKATLPVNTPPKPVAPPPAPVKPVADAHPTPEQPVVSHPPPQPVKTGKVSVPSTAHVKVDVPRGIQGFLDADPRMQPWVTSVIGVADACYTTERKTNPAAEGEIDVKVTMHENDRPDADILKLPPQLSGIVACATGKLMRIKMPLFTGKEGLKETVKLHFTK
jgi:hypothetical protein